ncbi:MAG: VCBS repeat-containing protein [Ignavibacteriales bacterium]|nr:VCBS repeat-containing protein [Ignavibacteriales bacterium]
MGIGDYDNNGFFDIYVSNDPTGNHLLKNNGDETFTDVTTQLGVAVNQVCWGANFFDFDNDSDMDLYVSVSVGSPNNNNVLFENQGDGTFSQVTGIGFDENYESYGNAIGDFDNNGYCDVAVFNTNGNMNLYQSSGGTNNWVKIILNGISTNKDGVGSKIEYYLGSDRYVRYIHCGISFASQSSSSQILGIGNASSIDSIIIYWTSSLVDKFYDVAPNQILLIEEGETIVPVELTSFTAQANNNEVVLNWSTATEINNSGFEIEKRQVFSPQSSIGNMNWNVVGFVPGFGTTTELKSYSFTDDDIAEANYQYRLKQIDFDGSYEYSNIVEVSIINADNFELEQNYPNPFNPATTISFNLENDSQVSLIIFDVLGQQVSHLINRELEAGRHSINFDASSLISGVYFYKLRVKNQSGTFLKL